MLPTGRNGPLPGLALAESPELRDIVLSDRQLGMLLEFLLDGDSVPESYNLRHSFGSPEPPRFSVTNAMTDRELRVKVAASQGVELLVSQLVPSLAGVISAMRWNIRTLRG